MANERLTSFGITYDMSDITALADSTPATSFNKDFADIDKLKTTVVKPGQMTLEHNYCILDGVQEEFDVEPDIAFFTEEMSDENGEFETVPTITVSFTEYHSSYALTINFIDDSALQVRCTWYQDNTPIFVNVFDVDDRNFIIRESVQNYNGLKIEFIKTIPYRYVKVNYIRYGVLIDWTENEVKTANLTMNIDRLSSQLSTNNLDFNVIDPADETNPGNTKGLHNYFQRTQVMYPYEIVNGQRIDLGRYFLDSFSYEKNVCRINAVSYMGLFSDTIYDRGDVYDGTKAGVILDDVFAVLGIENYTIDETTYNQLIYGILPPADCKTIIQQILFACNSIIDTTNLENIRITKSTTVTYGTISRGTKMNTRVTRTNYVSGVEVKFNNYALSVNASQAIKNEYEVGRHKVTFTEAYTDYSITGGTLVEQSTFYVIFDVATAGEVIITAKKYEPVENIVTVVRPYIEPGEGYNVQSYSTTLCNAATAKWLAQQILTYFDNRLEISVKHLISSANMNERWIVENSNPGMDKYIGIFTERNIDLTGGFIDNAVLIGYYDKADYQYYMNELGTDYIADDNRSI